jgi:MoaA/NifB/PqqE/SkfB family radical SAM enzyme
VRWLDLRIGYACNQACRFCDQGDLRERFVDADADAVGRRLRENAPSHDAVVLSGGEVTLRADLPALIARARGMGYRRVAVQTNGTVLAAAGAVESLREAGLTDVALALHGPSAAIHDGIVGQPGSFKRACAAARRAAAVGVQVSVNSVIARENYTSLPAWAALSTALGARALRARAVLARGRAAADARALVPRLELVEAPLVEAIRRALDARLDVGVLGVPLCRLGPYRALAADRLDAAPPTRRSALGHLEDPVATLYGPPCAGCPVRRACPGVEAAYVGRYGWGEIGAGGDLAAGGARGRGPEGVGGTAGELQFEVGTGETTRSLRARLVRLARSIGTLQRRQTIRVVDHGAEPAIVGLVEREAARLGFELPGGDKASASDGPGSQLE